MSASTRHPVSKFVTAIAFCAVSSSAAALAPGQIGSVLTFPASGTSDNAYAAVMDPSGALVIAGSGNSGGYSTLARMATPGSADINFGVAGIYNHNFSATLPDFLRSIVRMGDGRYVACGEMFSPNGTARDFLVARFNADGTLDGSFNFSGFADTPFLMSGVAGMLIDTCNAVAVQSDGKVVAAGFTQQFGPERVAVVRYAADGSLDGTFGMGGKVVIDASVGPTSDSAAQALLIQPDGRVLVAGFAQGTSNSDFMMVRLERNGAPDLNFGSNGIVRTPVGTGSDYAYAMVLNPDESIVLAGQAQSSGIDFALVKYNANGSVDTTFGTNGRVITPVGPGEDIAYSLALMPWGSLVAAGSARISTTAQGSDIAAVAYKADGSLDRYFGNKGKLMAQVTAHADEVIYGLTMDASRTHLWAVGAGVPSTDRDFLVLEIGVPDTVFRDGFEVAM